MNNDSSEQVCVFFGTRSEATFYRAKVAPHVVYYLSELGPFPMYSFYFYIEKIL